MATTIAVDAVALLLAAWVFARPLAFPVVRGTAAFASLACAVASLVVAAPTSAPVPIRIAAAVTMFVAFCAVAAVVSPLGNSPDDDTSGGQTCGDWDPPSPDLPTGGIDDTQPEWWAEFEREFADYVARRPSTICT